MALTASFHKYTLQFKFDAGTSRGVLRERDTYFLKLRTPDKRACVGLGEASPLMGLSPEYIGIEKYLTKLCDSIGGFQLPSTSNDVAELVDRLVPKEAPSVRFALECALLDLMNEGNGLLFDGAFTEGKRSIPINGLIWMGSFDFMKEQVDAKIAEGYDCIKIKIGAIDFQKECELLDYIRQRYGQDLILRVDANGAFTTSTAGYRLETLKEYQLHSIEQPVRPGQPELMRKLCSSGSVPVALDEELIGVTDQRDQEVLLDLLKPHYIVLKPTLVGGLDAVRNWINIANTRGIGWWITSALESNVGLNALAQFTATLAPQMHQGLGTGQLYHNNIPPNNLYLTKGKMYYQS